MVAVDSKVIVEDGTCAHCAVHTKHVHHRDFPEIRAECGSVAEAVAHLGKTLCRAREGARNEWQREAIDLAIADVSHFRETLAEAEDVLQKSCQCGASVGEVVGSAHPKKRRPTRKL